MVVKKKQINGFTHITTKINGKPLVFLKKTGDIYFAEEVEKSFGQLEGLEVLGRVEKIDEKYKVKWVTKQNLDEKSTIVKLGKKDDKFVVYDTKTKAVYFEDDMTLKIGIVKTINNTQKKVTIAWIDMNKQLINKPSYKVIGEWNGKNIVYNRETSEVYYYEDLTRIIGYVENINSDALRIRIKWVK